MMSWCLNSSSLCLCDKGAYLDSRCVQHQKSMLEGGTEGSMGHTLVVVPHMTESYGKNTKSSTNAIPLCTLKNFPHHIEHTLQVLSTKPKECVCVFFFVIFFSEFCPPDCVWTNSSA